MNTKQTEALQLALEALEMSELFIDVYQGRTLDKPRMESARRTAITAIREALANLPACEHEWLRGGCLKCGQSIEKSAPAPPVREQQEAQIVRWNCPCGNKYTFRGFTQAPASKPLTDEQKVALCKQFPDHLTFNAIHAIEAAHGIKGDA